MGSSGSRFDFSEAINEFENSTESDLVTNFKFLDCVISVEDVYEIFSPARIRDLIHKKPEKLVALLSECCKRIYTAYDFSLDRALVDDAERHVLANSIRIISRIAPFINESLEPDHFTNLLWSSTSFPSSIEEAQPESTGFALIGALMRSAFIRGFSLPSNCTSPHSSIDPNRVDPNIVWGRRGGVGGVPLLRPGYHAVPDQMLETRIEIIRMGLVLLCGPLFQSMGEYKNRIPVFNNLISSGDFIHTANFFMSLVFSVLDYETTHYAVPVISSVLHSDDTSRGERLATSALTLINVLVDPPNREEDINVFREIVGGGLWSEKDDELVNFVRFLKSKVMGLFGGRKKVGVTQTYELKNKNGFVLFIFNLLMLSPGDALMDEIRHQWGSDLVLAMLSLLVVHASDPAQVGLVHSTSFVLLRLSTNREFVLEVFRREYKGEIDHIFLKGLISTKIADIFFHTLLRLLSANVVAESLGEMWLTILCNLSPLVGGGLSGPTAIALVSSLEKMSRPGWLLKQPQRYHSISFLLETINSILQYQYDGSSPLVYELILRGGKILASLDSMSGQLHVYNEEWKQVGLLEPLRQLIAYLGPRIEDECVKREGEIGYEEVSDMIRKISLVGVIPAPRPIVVRQLHMNEQTRLWFTSLLYGIVFISLSSMPILDWKKVRMITLNTQEAENE
jgi:hypothetical protein